MQTTKLDLNFLPALVQGLVCLVALFVNCQANADDHKQLNQRAFEVLETYCYRCHGVTQKLPDFDVLSFESLTKERGDEDDSTKFVTPGNVDESAMWEYIEGDGAYMPMEGSPEADQIKDEHREIIRQWIESGANFPERNVRKFRSTKMDLTAIRNHLIQASPESRRHLRFFTLSHLSNNNAQVTGFDLQVVRAALSKLLNSLSWQSRIVLPQEVSGTDGTVFAIDLRDFEWTGGREWMQVINHNPYGLKLSYVEDSELKQLASDVSSLSGAELPVVRADWFVFAASRPPLYHDLLELPRRVDELEAMVGVNTIENIKRGKAARAGFGRSGVSRQNRMVERHDSKFGAYWISYDFLPRRGRGDLIRYPLGPVFEGNSFKRHAFEHDGGEAIFHLPNGLQAYYLVDAVGERLDGPAPSDVVFDSAAVAGTPAIINGVSCMNCHREGMITGFRDEIRQSKALFGEALAKVKELYVPHEQMEKLTQRDRDQFLKALTSATGPFLQHGKHESKLINEFPEPIGRVVQRYLADLGPNEVALELGYENIDQIRPQIEHVRDLRKLGLGTLVQDKPGTIKRARWEAIDGTSFFQDVAVELRLGTPVLPGTTAVLSQRTRRRD